MFLKDLFRRVHVAYIRLRTGLCKKEFLPQGKVLIVAPHPDDEVIGCGGLITKLVATGNPPYIVILTQGEGSLKSSSIPKIEIAEARKNLTRNALNILGVPETHVYHLSFPDGGVSEAHKEISRLSNIIAEISPDMVFVPHWGEGWNDHIKVSGIIKSIVYPKVEIWEYCVWVWFYNIWRGLKWSNASVLKMTNKEHSLKLKAVDAYIKPLSPCGNPWSGNLPQIFVDANSWNKELYFKI